MLSIYHAYQFMLSFMKVYGAIFIIFVTIGYFGLGIHYPLQEILLNFFGLKATICYEWWYVRFYNIILFIFPAMDYLYRKIENKFKYIHTLVIMILLASAFFKPPASKGGL